MVTALQYQISSRQFFKLVKLLFEHTMSNPESSAAPVDGAPETETWDSAAEKRENGANGTTPGRTRRPRQTVSQVAAPMFTELGNPGPLGLLSFAITTFVVGLLQCGAGYERSIIPKQVELLANLSIQTS